MSPQKHPCPCCGYYTLEEEMYDICPVCFWEDDPIQTDKPDTSRGANRITLTQGRQNYQRYGASKPDRLSCCRLPLPEELPENQPVTTPLERRIDMSTQKARCPCCGNYTIDNLSNICPVCLWKYYPTAGMHPSEQRFSTCYGIPLDRARFNYRLCGCCDPDKQDRCRPPLPEELPENQPSAEVTDSVSAQGSRSHFFSEKEALVFGALNDFIYDHMDQELELFLPDGSHLTAIWFSCCERENHLSLHNSCYEEYWELDLKIRRVLQCGSQPTTPGSILTLNYHYTPLWYRVYGSGEPPIPTFPENCPGKPVRDSSFFSEKERLVMDPFLEQLRRRPDACFELLTAEGCDLLAAWLDDFPREQVLADGCRERVRTLRFLVQKVLSNGGILFFPGDIFTVDCHRLPLALRPLRPHIPQPGFTVRKVTYPPKLSRPKEPIQRFPFFLRLPMEKGYRCQCCGHTPVRDHLRAPCPVCGWTYDPIQAQNPANYYDAPSGICLVQAQENYHRYGCFDPRLLQQDPPAPPEKTSRTPFPRLPKPIANLEELDCELQLLGLIPNADYLIENPLSDEDTPAIHRFGNGWEVCRIKQNHRHDSLFFPTLSHACTHLYGQLYTALADKEALPWRLPAGRLTQRKRDRAARLADLKKRRLLPSRLHYHCPCCGNLTLSLDLHDVCPVCFWEDDPYQLENPDRTGLTNGVSLNQARVNYAEFHACAQDVRAFCRRPKREEICSSPHIKRYPFFR